MRLANAKGITRGSGGWGVKNVIAKNAGNGSAARDARQCELVLCPDCNCLEVKDLAGGLAALDLLCDLTFLRDCKSGVLHGGGQGSGGGGSRATSNDIVSGKEIEQKVSGIELRMGGGEGQFGVGKST